MHKAEAQAWLDRMVVRGITPDAVSYNGVCSAHARVHGEPREVPAQRRELRGVAQRADGLERAHRAVHGSRRRRLSCSCHTPDA